MSTSDRAEHAPVAELHKSKLRYCHTLLRKLDPNRAPVGVNSKEFRWQYLALQERAHIYADRLSDLETKGSSQSNRMALRKAMNAIQMSLIFFDDVLNPKSDSDDQFQL